MRRFKCTNSFWSPVSHQSFRSQASFALLLSFLAGATSSYVPAVAEVKRPAPAAAASAAPAPEIKLPTDGTLSMVVLRGPEYEIRESIKKQVEELVKKKDFVGLDALADKLRKSKAIYPDGSWHLTTFYQNLRLDSDQQKSDAVFQERFKLFNDWIKKYPKSPTARAALIDTWTDYAWVARGSGYANTVSKDGWKNFEDRIKAADTVFKEAKTLPVVCPKSYSGELLVCLAQSRDHAEYDKVYKEAIKLEPTYITFYFDKMYYLTPRWHGEDGEMEHYVANTADRMGKDAGDIFYARMVWLLNDFNLEGDALFVNTKLSWKRAKRGLELLLKQKSDWAPVQAEYAVLATIADDKPAAREMFKKIGNNVDKYSWTKAWFRYRKDQALSTKPVNKSDGKPPDEDDNSEDDSGK